MALKMSYTDKRDDTHANSYWVISDMDVFKKLYTSEDMLRASLNLTDDDDQPEVKAAAKDTTPGYYVHFTVCGFKSKAERDAGKPPIAIAFAQPTKHPTWFCYIDEHQVNELDDMPWDISSEANMLAAGYAFLKTIDFFKDATDEN
tara:strand:+ start:471 stop:908 length:438 start_codon:yes stop_codon:yes gene_type:complete